MAPLVAPKGGAPPPLQVNGARAVATDPSPKVMTALESSAAHLRGASVNLDRERDVSTERATRVAAPFTHLQVIDDGALNRWDQPCRCGAGNYSASCDRCRDAARHYDQVMERRAYELRRMAQARGVRAPVYEMNDRRTDRRPRRL